MPMENCEHPDDCRVFLQKGMLPRIAKFHPKYSRRNKEEIRSPSEDEIIAALLNTDMN
jgi:hypothetical protein